MGAAVATVKDFFVGRRSGLREERGTLMASAMEDAMRTMEVKSVLLLNLNVSMISIHEEGEDESASSLD